MIEVKQYLAGMPGIEIHPNKRTGIPKVGKGSGILDERGVSFV